MKYFWFDPHLNREGLNTLNRPFASALEMSEHLIEEVNIKVRRQDELYIGGDFTQDVPGYWRQRIKCRNVWMVEGNHDHTTARLERVFGQYKVKQRFFTKIKGVYTVVDHFPGAYWDKSHYNAFMLYGHVHDQREETLDAIWPERRSMDCGVDPAKRILGRYCPFSEDEIYDILSPRKGHDPVEFYHALRGKYEHKD